MSKQAIVLQPYPLPGPDICVLSSLPMRVQKMVELLLAHQEIIGTYNIGSVELHFHRQSVEVRLCCNLSQ